MSLHERFCHVLRLVVVLGALASSYQAQAAPIDDINRLDVLFWEQIENNQFAEAERTARRMMDIGRANWQQDQTLYCYGLFNLGEAFNYSGEYSAAEKTMRQVVDFGAKAFGTDSSEYADAIEGLGRACYANGNHADAEKFLIQAISLYDAYYGSPNESSINAAMSLADVLVMFDRFEEAQARYREALTFLENAYGRDSAETIDALFGLAKGYRLADRYDEAEPLYHRAMAIAIKAGASRVRTHSDCLGALSRCALARSAHDEAIALAAKSLTLAEGVVGKEHPDLGYPLDDLAWAHISAGHYAEAEAAAKRAVELREKSLGAVHPDVADSLGTLGYVLSSQGRYAESEAILSRQVAACERLYGLNNSSTAFAWVNRGIALANVGRLGESEALLIKARRVFQDASGATSSSYLEAVLTLAEVYTCQRRFDEAARLYDEATDLGRRLFGDDSQFVAYALVSHATMLAESKRYAEAEDMIRAAMRIHEKILHAEHPDRADSLGLLAGTLARSGRHQEALPLFDQATAVAEKAYGAEYGWIGSILTSQAYCLFELSREREAEPLLDRAIRLMDRANLLPSERSQAYLLRARVAWRAGRKSEAMADLREAMRLAEEQRGNVGGAERERAAFFGEMSEVFEQMVAWQVELGDASEALAAIERARARSLLDEITRMGADLDVGQSAGSQNQLRRREEELSSRVASLEKQIETLVRLNDPTTHARRDQLDAELARARQDMYDQFRDARSANPVYRNLLSVNATTPRISQVQNAILGPSALMLVYLLGGEGGYVVVIDAERAELARLVVDDAAAAALGIAAGPLNAERLKNVLMNDDGTGVMQHVSRPDMADGTAARLAALWRTLVPEAIRERLTSGAATELFVVPDGPLALLPFETLVASTDGPVRFLLDVGPPVIYAPSVSVLFNLAERAARPVTAPQPVLTVGDPVYRARTTSEAPTETLLASTRYAGLGHALTPLPHSGTESRWVADVFRRQGIEAAALSSAEATEENVRAAAAGRSIVHLACHGLTDQTYGNFFGALALTSTTTDAAAPRSDGFLTYPEIYDLDLSACELAILSACETNYGPQQQGEGTWALSRGFLVAGARRVVASNWLVDDEAAASLVSYFCGGVATAQTAGSAIDYARALHEAKRWVRQQPKWQSPFYWGTFVLVGPN